MSLFLHLSVEAASCNVEGGDHKPPWPMFNVWALFWKHPLSLFSVPSVKATAETDQAVSTLSLGLGSILTNFGKFPMLFKSHLPLQQQEAYLQVVCLLA